MVADKQGPEAGKEPAQPNNGSDGEPEGDSEGDVDDDNPKKNKRQRVECIMGDFTDEQLRNMNP